MTEHNQAKMPVIALAGNPNVGKSSLFNKLTGLRQHTGNWAGKTVDSATGTCSYKGRSYILADIPGTYSLLPHSPEEEVARDFILLEKPDAVIVVCDASCLERNLNLVLQTCEITDRVIMCVNLIDEAKRHNVEVDLEQLSRDMGIPVVGTVAKTGKGLDRLMDAAEEVIKNKPPAKKIRYLRPIEDALSGIEKVLRDKFPSTEISRRWFALRILESDSTLSGVLGEDIFREITNNNDIKDILCQCSNQCEHIPDTIAACTVLSAEEIACRAIKSSASGNIPDRKIDSIVTSKIFGIPIMLSLLALIFWLTISFANIPSGMLSRLFTYIEGLLVSFAIRVNIPEWIYNPLIFGVYHVLTWVIAVMLPPMVIFFPLFTLLEDLGFLPRIAFNLDNGFKKCSACGKQALTMCMGFGCNAVGVTGCRIIDSPRERLIAILTNCFVPCNGRFPMLISVISMFLVFSPGSNSTFWGALVLTLTVLTGIFVTFLVSKLLSQTLLRGTPSSFIMELPPYRKPDIPGIIVRSVYDRIIFVLLRAVTVAAPAGLVIWLLANTTVNGITLLAHLSGFLDPFARLMGIDGQILLAFILGFPANEIVIPLIIMSYMSAGVISDSMSLLQIRDLFVANGWTFVTAVNVILFSLMHWPCSTTLLTIKKETGSTRWTIAAFLIPTIVGMGVCILFTRIMNII